MPHGFAVISTSPAAFRFTYPSSPEKHQRAAELIAGKSLPDADENTLPNVLIQLMKDVGTPSGLKAFGYDEGDIDKLVEGAIKQQRQLQIAPREPGPDDLANIFRESMENW